MHIHRGLGLVAASLMMMACTASPPDGPSEEEASQSPEPEKVATVESELAAECDWRAIGDAMDRMTAMCTSWGYDQGVFRFNGCRVTLLHCIHW